MKEYTFSNGVTVLEGARLLSPCSAIQKDESVYENGSQFDGFRFSKMRERDGESANHYASSTGLDYLQFGHGQHAWFFHS
jgi:cytochrome P450